MIDVILTTASRRQQEIEVEAKQLSKQWNIPFITREKHPISYFHSTFQVSDVLVLDHQSDLTWHKQNEGAIKYHPGMAIIRIKRLQSGNNDSMADILNLSTKDSILDCTLGLASDAIVSQFIANEGQVVGLEAEKLLALFTKRGLETYKIPNKRISDSMSKINVVHINYNEYLKKAASQSFDYIYFDPMFRESIDTSTSMQIIKSRCNHEPISIESIKQAKRVARKKIVLKETSNSTEFKRLGFRQIYRPNSSFSYGIIDMEGDYEKTR